MNMKPYGNEIFSNNQRYADVFCRGVFFLTAGCQKSQRSGTENGAGGWEHPKWIMDHWLDPVVDEYT